MKPEYDLSSLSSDVFDDVEATLVDWAMAEDKVPHLLAAASECLGRMDAETAGRLLEKMRGTADNFREAVRNVRIVDYN